MTKLDQSMKVFLKEVDETHAQEVLQQLMLEHIDELDTFEMFLEVLAENGGDLTKIVGLTHTPVPVREFVESDYFLNMKEAVWPGVMTVAEEVIRGGYVEALLMGAIGIGKTSVAQIITAYHLYLMSLEKFPQLRYGLFPTSSIVLAMMNTTQYLAERVTFGEFRQMLEPVHYFREHFPFPTDVKSKMEFPNNINVLPSAASAQKILGQNVIGGVVDEMDFMQVIKESKQASGQEYNQAKVIATKLVARRKSRFQRKGRMPGCICFVSSKGAPGAFMEVRKTEAEQEADNLTYIWEKAQWEVTPAERWQCRPTEDGPYDEQFMFPIELGDERHNSRIIDSKDKARPGAKVLMVPIELKRDFKYSMEESLRDLAGIATLSKRPFFSSREKIWNMAEMHARAGYQNVFAVEEWDLSNGPPPINENFVLKLPDRRRVAHVDLGLTSDKCGIAIGHVVSTQFIRVNSVANHEEFVVEEVPIIAYDGVITINPPSGGEIDFAEVRAILYTLRDEHGIPIKHVTYDGFQSVDSRQTLRKMGFRAGYLTVAGKESVPAYRGMRSAVFNNRVLAPEHSIAFNELAKLEHNKEKDIIDHPVGEHDDTANAMCGVFTSLMKRRGNWRSGDDDIGDEAINEAINSSSEAVDKDVVKKVKDRARTRQKARPAGKIPVMRRR